jgi:hypothetical protein
MSSGHEIKQTGVRLITLEPEEFNRVVKRVHDLLVRRMESARKRSGGRPTDKAERNHVEAAKDHFVFTRMMELIEHMSGEISDLQDILAANEPEQESDPTELPEMFAPKKTNFIN